CIGVPKRLAIAAKGRSYSRKSDCRDGSTPPPAGARLARDQCIGVPQRPAIAAKGRSYSRKSG
ncbi:MAG TPA: hypothetical protein VFG55_02720, partial [Rhodanobacteraceae bacterium]|nr:hypothetical protein [Rhodanobacteraceae bacterium]